MEYRFGELTVACTNTDRVMFPGSGITKGEVLAYYRDIADVMVPELRGRPLTLDRYTKGIDKGGFFQKHWQKHFPAWIDRVEVAGKTRVTYPICDTAASLVYFANQGTIAFHVCTFRKDRPGHPDVIVFDLDPPDGGFALVRRAARILYEVLGELGLPPFVKTSGSKGLHVVVPLDGTASYAEVGAFCDQVARDVCAAHPDVLTTAFYKKDREGRLFLDTMRNTFGATAVAAYSLRGRPGAPVSAPIAWHEVDDPSLAPDGFTLRDMRARLDTHGDPWRDLRAAPGSVATLSTLPVVPQG